MGCGSSQVTSTVDVRSNTPDSVLSSKNQAQRNGDAGKQSGAQANGVGQNHSDQSTRQAEQHRLEEEARRAAEERRLEEERRAEEQRRREELAAQQKRLEEAAEQRRQAESSPAVEQESSLKAEEDERQHQEQQALAVLPQTVSQQDAGSTEGGRTFTPVEIAQHNAQAGWVEWIPHRRKVYDGNVFREHFRAYMASRPAMLEARAQQRVSQGEDEEETEFKTYYSPLLVIAELPPITDPAAQKHNGVMVVMCQGISQEELARELPRCLLGSITGRSGPSFWSCFRNEVIALLNDLQAEGTAPDLTSVITRWQDRYGAEDPPEHPPPCDGVDPNSKSFPLPVDPETLRLWVLDFAWDCELPPEGAWPLAEVEDMDLGEPHEVFAATLRSDFSPDEEPFLFDIEGEAAWESLPDSVIKDGVMTTRQEEIQAARDKREDLHDPERMRKRREELCEYFITERELAPALVTEFMQWASLMEQNMAALQTLCDQQN